LPWIPGAIACALREEEEKEKGRERYGDDGVRVRDDHVDEEEED